MYTTTLTRSNQITLTKPAREALGVKAGDRLEIDIDRNGAIKVAKPMSDEEFLEKLDSFKSAKTKSTIKALANKSVHELIDNWASSPEGQLALKEEYGI